MKFRNFPFILIPSLILIIQTGDCQNPWSEQPNWESDDSRFTMSVALADLDNDGDLDLVAGNYKYPYTFPTDPPNPGYIEGESDFGDYLVAYEWGPSTPDEGYYSSIELTSSLHCIDCIAIADYDNDGDMDIAMGLVVGKGNDGGTIVLDNKFDTFPPGTHPETLAGYFDDQNPDYYWSNGVSFDCHCVRWTDFNNDGWLDLAALEIPGVVHIYQNEEEGGNRTFEEVAQYNFVSPSSFGNCLSYMGEGGDLTEEPLDRPLSGTTMEFGDMDGDGRLDLFINYGGQPMVLQNLYNGEDPLTAYGHHQYWAPTIDSPREDAFCASFGHYDDDLALAVGSMVHFGDPHNLDEYKWGNDIYVLENNRLHHVTRSDVELYDAQPVTDIQWAFLEGGNDEDMDLVAVSYPKYKEVTLGSGNYEWDLGLEQVHLNPDDIPPMATDIFSLYHDLSTSLALGDIDQEAVEDDTVRIHRMDSRMQNYRCLIYAKFFPFIDIVNVWFELDEAVIYPETPPRVAYDPQNGWFSIEPGLHISFPYGWDWFVIEYRFSRELDLAVGNDGKNVVYYNGSGGTVGDDPTVPGLGIIPPYGGNVHTYDEPQWPDEINLMAPDAVGLEIGPPEGFNIEDVLPRMDQMPSVRRIGFLALWNTIEIFKGHYFWHSLDWGLDALYTQDPSEYKSFIGAFMSPIWTIGNFDPDPPPPPDDDYKKRTSDERLHTMFTRNLVNRYRAGGLLNQAWTGYNWDDWGVDIFYSDFEPNWEGRDGYGDFPDARDATATRMYYFYQMIKQIDNSLVVVSPGFTNYFPEPADRYCGPPIPYLNRLNETQLSHIENYPGDDFDRVLWQYCDWIAPSMHCGFGLGGADSWRDPYSTACANDDPDLRLGIENILWGFYTFGLENYYPQNPHDDWTPVMYHMPAEDPYIEHPFFIFDWHFLSKNADPLDLPQQDWIAAEIAETFAVDVFPEDPTTNHYLVIYQVPWIANAPYAIPVVETCASLLNDPSPDQYGNTHISFIEYNDDAGPPDPDPPVFQYIYRHNNPLAEIDKYMHFIKTEYKNDLTGVSVADFYVKQDEEGWHLTDLMATYQPGETYEAICHTTSDNQFQKDIEQDGGEYGIHFAQGEMGPIMLMIEEPAAPVVADQYAQSLQLHPRWNLVSWHIEPLEPEFTFEQILPPENAPPPYQYADWFFENGGKLYKWDDRVNYYPLAYQSEPWILDYAYFMLLDIAHPWQFQYRPRFELNPITDFNPSPEWDSNRFDPQHLATEWFFMGYAAPGYCKLASIPVPGASPQCGDPEDYDYEGPFHWLIWENDGQDYPPYDLKIVRTDDGRFYIPTPDDPGDIVDQIEVLEPGRGYFLGFDAEVNETYTFEGWGNWPQWQNDQFIGPEPKSPVTQIASATHFQFNPYTHWAYPVLIDTVDLAEIPLAPGDEMGVFDGDLCVGASVYSGEFPLVIACWEDDIATPMEIDGYIWNDPMIFKWYDASENTEAELVSPPGTQAADDPIAPTYSGFGRGFYALRSFYGGAQNTVQFPKDYRLGQNYPNPFNAETVIPLELPERSKVKLEIFNVRGQRIGFPYENVYNAGWPRIRWNASRLPSGVYFYRITAEGLERGGKFHDVGKMLLLK